jgi:hypothetical protein
MRTTRPAEVDLDARGRRLRAGLAGVLVPDNAPELRLVREWRDSWSGIGHVAVGMHRQGFDLQLTQYDEHGWRATFYTTGMEHRRRARPAPRGSVPRGARCSGRRGTRCGRVSI